MTSKDISIQVRGLGKKYRIGGPQEKYLTFRDAITNSFKAPFKRFTSQGAPPEFWALKDVSFDVEQGEVVGIIGRNGAGKSTLLKILSRITTPTEGTVDLYGRVGSLLEVGTGFHPELTGRENIFLSGSILGMKKREIEERFDEIVKFSEIEKFLETPVKRYSSGMYVRLAFAVAAHLDPEILLVDEVLAVGDAQFQKKCLGKMGEVAKEGRTVLFVSHNMGAISSLCSRGMLFQNGVITMNNFTDSVVNKYLEDISIDSYSFSNYDVQEYPAFIAEVRLKSLNLNNSSIFLMTEPIIVDCYLKIIKKSYNSLSIQIKEMNMEPIFHFPNEDSLFKIPSEPGDYLVSIKISPLFLYPGSYFMRIALTDIATKHQEAIEGIRFDINQDYNVCRRPLPRKAGLIFATPEWSCHKLDNQ